MNWTTTLPFILDNVDGDLKITYNPWGQKFYQNGQEIKRTGSDFRSCIFILLKTGF